MSSAAFASACTRKVQYASQYDIYKTLLKDSSRQKCSLREQLLSRSIKEDELTSSFETERTSGLCVASGSDQLTRHDLSQ